jgi:threonylcarbamoyladenosine tRNA methylthiotransferase MtaB
VFVINTCSVTENADKKCRQLVKRALKINPEAFIAIIGCYAQLKPEEIATIDGVDTVLGAADKFKIVERFQDLEKKEKTEVYASKIKEVKDFVPTYSKGDRTRSFLKIQDGCDYFCTFCTIPLARGKSRNHSIAETIAVAKEVADTAAKEVILTGVNIGDFGQGETENFYELLSELEMIEGIDRYRISSIEPNLLSNDIIELVAASNKIMPHFHIPLQSGSNRILEAMRRKYKRELYQDRVTRIKELMPHACIGVDVIVGFPGETEEEFMATYNFLNELDVSYLHVFTYSERPNTTAIKMEGAVPKEERAKRSKMLHILSEKKKRYFYQQHLGKSHEVLFEAEQHDDFLNGFTSNYIKVKVPYDPSLENQIKTINLADIDLDGIVRVELTETPSRI